MPSKDNKKEILSSSSIILKDEPFDVVSITYPNPDLEDDQLKRHNFAMDFTREELDMINVNDLPTTYQHKLISGKITSKHLFKNGPMIVTTTISGKDPFGKEIIADILNGKLTETSLSHKYIIKQVETAPHEKKKIKVYKIPQEMAYVEKGVRDNCHILMAGFRSDIENNIKKMIHGDKTSNNALPFGMEESVANEMTINAPLLDIDGNIKSASSKEDNNGVITNTTARLKPYITNKDLEAYLEHTKFDLEPYTKSHFNPVSSSSSESNSNKMETPQVTNATNNTVEPAKSIPTDVDAKSVSTTVTIPTTPSTTTSNNNNNVQPQTNPSDTNESVEEKEARLKYESAKRKREEMEKQSSSSASASEVKFNESELAKMDQKQLMQIISSTLPQFNNAIKANNDLKNKMIEMEERAKIGDNVLQSQQKQAADLIKTTKSNAIEELKKAYPTATTEQIEGFMKSFDKLIPSAESSKPSDIENLLEKNQAVVGLVECSAQYRQEIDRLRGELSILERKQAPSVDNALKQIGSIPIHTPSLISGGSTTTTKSSEFFVDVSRFGKSPFASMSSRFENYNESSNKKAKVEPVATNAAPTVENNNVSNTNNNTSSAPQQQSYDPRLYEAARFKQQYGYEPLGFTFNK